MVIPVTTTNVAESVIQWTTDSGGGRALSAALGMRAPLVTELVMFNYGRLPRHNATKSHLHTFHQVDVVLEGRVTHRVEGMAACELAAGDALLIAPLSLHESQSATGFVHASFKLFLAPHAAARLGWSMTFRPSPALLALQSEIGRSIARQEAHAADCASAAASLLVAQALRSRPEQKPDPAPIDDFRRLVLPVLQGVDENPGAQWTVEAMAEACNLSVDYFTRCFHRAFRQTPMQYLLTARMRRAAAELMASPPVAIKQVAQRLGYSSVQTFSRAFRAAVGISPARFRAAPGGGHVSQYL